MTEEEERRARIEARIQRGVERTVAPYAGKAPPVVMRKLRELAERYYREHPQASRIIELLEDQSRIRSGDRTTGLPGDAADAAAADAADRTRKA